MYSLSLGSRQDGYIFHTLPCLLSGHYTVRRHAGDKRRALLELLVALLRILYALRTMAAVTGFVLCKASRRQGFKASSCNLWPISKA